MGDTLKASQLEFSVYMQVTGVFVYLRQWLRQAFYFRKPAFI